jgi:DNA-binding beta-propeller fold protein YncE
MDLAGTTNDIVDLDFRDIVFEAANGKTFALESDTFAGSALEIVEVNVTTGETTLVPTGVTPDNTATLNSPFDIEIDPNNNRAFVTDVDEAAILAIDLDTGSRVLFSDNTISVGASNIEFAYPKGIVMDSANNRLLVTDPTLDAVIAVSLDTGARTLFSDNTTELANSTVEFSSPRYIALDTANNRALILDSTTIIAVSLSTGARTVLTNNDIVSDIDLSSQSDLTVDSANNRALVSDLNRDSVIAVDLDTGVRTVLVDSTTPIVGADGFQKPLGITIDPANNRIILVDWWLNTVNEADLDTGVLTRLAPSSGANSFFTFQSSSVVYDAEHNRALVVEMNRDAIIAVDLITGARVILSQ